MEFDFLPKLPNSNLDDRTFDELVDECILRIPRYCPEWTDRNLSDPGVTLIELFAWLSDQMLMRFNQVPRKNYVAFLELLGIRLHSPNPAQTDITFYLTTDLPEAYTISTGTEVATERTETEEAIIFSTDEELTIGKPRLRHFLVASTADDTPQALSDRTSHWDRQGESAWTGNELGLFPEQPQPGNCFYLAIGSEEPLEGNVLAVNFKGAKGTPTGIDPNHPPRRWEAWNGKSWQPVLLRESNDGTRGFSFHEVAQQGGNPEQGGDVVLHLPQNWPNTNFTAYRGRWLRCVLTNPKSNQQPNYASSPRVTGLAVRSIGGSVRASQSITIEREQLGISNGKPGQSFQVQSPPILKRGAGEYIEVAPPNGQVQTWKEVPDFADSGPDSLHYTIDSLTGTVQFGPLIREPEALKLQTQVREDIQDSLPEETFAGEETQLRLLERQYGAVPPRGSVITMVAYRTGGGKKGNVQAGTLRFLKSAIPYVASVTNHYPARNGADAESLDQAVLRAPRMLRTRDRAVTAEDFEVLTLQAEAGIARVKCLPASESRFSGSVSLLIVPQANTDAIDLGLGIAPERFALTPTLQQQVLNYLDERRLLGVQVHLQAPEYTGVAVQAEVGLEPAYNNPTARREILNQLRVTLYRYLNPLTGGLEGTGWSFGRPVYPSDIVALLQKIPGVRYLGAVLLFSLRRQGETWQRQTTPESFIDPGPFGLICSWADDRLRASHDIRQINS